MRISFSKKHWLVLGVIILFVIGIVFWVRYEYIVPVIQKKESIQMSLENEIKIMESLQQQLQEGNETEHESTILLQKKLPVNPLIDQLLLDISQAEMLSRSHVLSISFEDVEITNYREIINDQDEETTGENSLDQEENEEGKEEAPKSEYNVDGLHKIIASIELKASDYKQLSRFIEEIDKLPRIINIESIHFTDDTGELMTIDDKMYELFFEVQLSTYYKPTLEELKEDDPQIDYPDPANKDDPLYVN